MPTQLRAVVIGAGMAGEGHTVALRYAGVDVVAICSRTADVVKSVAKRLDVKQTSTDWRRTLLAEKPDIVAVATPARPHVEQITAALELGCNVFSDKPLAVSAGEARHLYELSLRAGRKTAIATTFMYDPGVAYLTELIAAGAIGRPLEVECSMAFPWPFPVAATWMNRLAEGGGLLNNRLPHQLAAVRRVVGGEALQVMGEARVCRSELPNVGHLHDYRHRRKLLPEELTGKSWDTVDADDAYTVLVRLGVPGSGPHDYVLARIYANAWIRPREERAITVHGEAGSLHYAAWLRMASHNSTDVPCISRGRLSSQEWENESIPDRIFQRLPDIAEDTQRDWASLAREFVADVRSEAHDPYPTFREGWINQEIIDLVRSGVGWATVPQDLPS